jgi:hypothetical protein
MPSSTTPGSPIIDSSRAAMSTWPSPRVDRLGTPKAPAIRFARAMTFVASWFTHLLRPARLLAPRYGSDHLRGQRGLLLPGFQRDEPVAGYNYSSDWTPLLTGLSPARMAASLAAPTPSSQGTCTLYSLPVSRRFAYLVRFTPVSDPRADIRNRQLRAMSHMTPCSIEGTTRDKGRNGRSFRSGIAYTSVSPALQPRPILKGRASRTSSV